MNNNLVINYITFKDCILVLKDSYRYMNLYTTDSHEEVPTIQIPSCQNVVYKVNKLEELSIRDKVNVKEFYQLTEDNSPLPETVTKETYNKLTDDFKKKYKKVQTAEVVFIPITEDQEFNEIFKTDETFEEYYKVKDLPQGITIVYKNHQRYYFVENYLKFLYSKLAELNKPGTKIIFSSGVLHFLEEAWDGSYKKILDRKRNGTYYRDQRGRQVMDYKSVDTINLPSATLTTLQLYFDSVAEAEATCELFISKLLEI